MPGKRDVTIRAIEPIGNYAVRLVFSDGHNTGLYSWLYLYEIASRKEELWNGYLQELAARAAAGTAEAARRSNRALKKCRRFAICFRATRAQRLSATRAAHRLLRRILESHHERRARAGGAKTEEPRFPRSLRTEPSHSRPAPAMRSGKPMGISTAMTEGAAEWFRTSSKQLARKTRSSKGGSTCLRTQIQPARHPSTPATVTVTVLPLQLAR